MRRRRSRPLGPGEWTIDGQFPPLRGSSRRPSPARSSEVMHPSRCRRVVWHRVQLVRTEVAFHHRRWQMPNLRPSAGPTMARQDRRVGRGCEPMHSLECSRVMGERVPRARGAHRTPDLGCGSGAPASAGGAGGSPGPRRRAAQKLQTCWPAWSAGGWESPRRTERRSGETFDGQRTDRVADPNGAAGNASQVCPRLARSASPSGARRRGPYPGCRFYSV